MEVLVNNVKLYYEEYGVGKPIILLHGNQETHEIFDKLIAPAQNPITKSL